MTSFGRAPKGRLEDGRMLTGKGRYVSDWTLPNQAHGHFLRSDRPHAKILSIDASAAMAMPGVIAVITAITPGIASAADASIDTIFACGRSERRKCPQAWLGSIQSET